MQQAFKAFHFNLRQRNVTITRPWIMGILNVTPDSFFADSRATTDQDVELRLRQMIDEGADIIDVGAYSTRPGADEVSENDEITRIKMALNVIRRVAPTAIVSVDTFRSQVAKIAVEECGADIINDVSGGNLDKNMSTTVAQLCVPAIVMHISGTPATMQQLTHYDNLVADVVSELGLTLQKWRDAGAEQLIADPGFGFSKTIEQNYELMAHLDAFHALKIPLLVGISRKSMIYRLLNCSPQEALNGTTVLNTMALLQGAHILRVHDVKAAVEARQLVAALSAGKN
ncbi:MAG: dihydropteroate synthase [Muribaculaceae bacterium]|nr:dihydropteroate synthase [Muribaculaceae bacterium]